VLRCRVFYLSSLLDKELERTRETIICCASIASNGPVFIDQRHNRRVKKKKKKEGRGIIETGELRYTQSPGTEVPYIHGQKIVYISLFLFFSRSLWLAIEMDLSTSSLNPFFGVHLLAIVHLSRSVCNTPPLKSRGSERGKKKKKKSCAE
jgi:hypothetical protein